VVTDQCQGTPSLMSFLQPLARTTGVPPLSTRVLGTHLCSCVQAGITVVWLGLPVLLCQPKPSVGSAMSRRWYTCRLWCDRSTSSLAQLRTCEGLKVPVFGGGANGNLLQPLPSLENISGGGTIGWEVSMTPGLVRSCLSPNSSLPIDSRQ
jgi:hypothetical protein